MSQWDAVRIAPGELHGMEAGPDGAEMLAFGAPNTENKDADMQPGGPRRASGLRSRARRRPATGRDGFA